MPESCRRKTATNSAFAAMDKISSGSKCYLRAVTADDAEAFYKWYCCGEVQQHLANPWWNPSIDFDSYRLYRFAQYLEPNPTSGVLVICTTEGAPIGLVNYFDLDEANRICEVGIIIGELAVWRQGYALAALGLLIEFLVSKFDIAAIRARILKENVASQELFRKVGFVQSGSSEELGFQFLEYYYTVANRESLL